MYKPLVPDHDGNISSLSLERRHSCHLNNEPFCESVNKSLVVSFWREMSRDKWLPANILRVFPSNHFDHVIMLHDTSNWSNHPGLQTGQIIPDFKLSFGFALLIRFASGTSNVSCHLKFFVHIDIYG
jgi:hypothetical protein